MLHTVEDAFLGKSQNFLLGRFSEIAASFFPEKHGFREGRVTGSPYTRRFAKATCQWVFLCSKERVTNRYCLHIFTMTKQPTHKYISLCWNNLTKLHSTIVV